MKIGLYFGSFNPIHAGHLIIINHVLNETELDRAWFVVSPQNPFKPNGSLLNEYDRLHLVRLATEDDPRVRVSDIEFHLPRPSYTTETLAYLSEKYPDHVFSLILGSDSFQNLDKWKNYRAIVDQYHLYIYKRPGFAVENTFGARVTLLDAPLLQLSATGIRELVRRGKSIRYLVPDKVREEIERNRYYRN
ncbi:MAG TPA: nicotinate (nicotinamide) nucleotide adenylyltransferase [Chitinophagaceae bacterium]|nr:nicotinate (nicotinamide) nucleotide adenylyltransferase [Chitinophagaceae bacterium]